ncbi:hypothetical protein [Sinomonas sp. B1-1]|uniref:hypothetical protein n=1 Tax=Sinomonas sp. B1-1 TaxID=3141454 RepID=UPI003D2A93C9
MSEDPQLPGPGAARGREHEAVVPETEQALAALDAAEALPLAERAAAFEAFHAALSGVLGVEPGE